LEWEPARRFETGREGSAPRAVVLHTTVGSLTSAVAWFKDRRSEVSAHYVVGRDGRVVHMVAEPDTAFHVGRADRHVGPLDGRHANRSTIGIELVDDGDPDVERTPAQHLAVVGLVAQAARRWRVPLDRAHVLAHHELDTKKRCPGNVDVDRVVDDAQRMTADLPRPTICLAPIRNGADRLDTFLDSIATFADGVVALDDGSTDGTAERLVASPLVRVLLRNPVRPTAAGWDDGKNRARLLEAAAGVDPGWIVSLDADEHICRDDAVALRNFVGRDALPGCAYAFEHYRMWGSRYDPRCHLVYRLFAFRRGQRFPAQRLHFNPIPTDIPRRAWLHTSVRVQHFGASDDTALHARLRKYREADPDREYPLEFGGLASRPAELRTWEPRGTRDVLTG
jgi:hypothetical protein